MDNHRQLKKAKLSDLQAKREKIRQKALTTCRVIMPLIDATLSEVVEMDIAAAADAMDELVMYKSELLAFNSKITQLEEALYG